MNDWLSHEAHEGFVDEFEIVFHIVFHLSDRTSFVWYGCRHMSRIVRIFWIFLRPLARLHAYVTRPLTLGVRGLVRDEEGRILLVRHSYVAGWYFPGGGVERGETTLTALTRELDEEAGVILTGVPRFVGLYANFREFKSDHVAFYVIEAGQYELEERRSFEIAEYGFFGLDALPDEITRATRARLVELEQDAPSPEFW